MLKGRDKEVGTKMPRSKELIGDHKQCVFFVVYDLTRLTTTVI
jgi:hypothetical protein